MDEQRGFAEEGTTFGTIGDLIARIEDRPSGEISSIDAIELRHDIVRVAAGEILFREGETSDALFVVQSGQFQVLLRPVDGDGRQERVLNRLGPGDPIGEMSLFTGGRRNATVRAMTDGLLVRVSRLDLERLFERHPKLESHLIQVAVGRLKRTQLQNVLGRLIGDIDHETIERLRGLMEWRHLDPREILFARGDAGDGLYIVVSGQLNIIDPDGSKAIIDTVNAGEIVGEIALVTGEKRGVTIRAARNSELVHLSSESFERFGADYPAVYRSVARAIVERLRGLAGSIGMRSRSRNVALVPLASDIPCAELASLLEETLSDHGRSRRLDPQIADRELSGDEVWKADPETPQGFRLAAWLDDQESSFENLVISADGLRDQWDELARELSERTLLLAWAGRAIEERGDLRETVSFWSERGTPWLVLLHAEEDEEWGAAGPWLELTGAERVIHLRLGRREDAERLARYLTGTAIGLVLGGGGAKGISHIGAVRALREAGIPIDYIAGTSIGAIVGGLAAMEREAAEILDRCEEMFVKVNPFNKFTLPMLSILSPGPTTYIARLAFADRQIEDLPVPFACVSTNLTTAKKMIHRSGAMWQAVLASASLPGIIQPVPYDGALLVDGGVTDNLPVSVLPRECGVIIACDLHSDRTIATDYRRFPSPRRLLFQRLFKRSLRHRAPTIFEIISGVMQVTTDGAVEEVTSRVDLSLHPPMEEVGFLDFSSLREIEQRGYDYARGRIAAIDEEELRRRLLMP